MEEFTKLVELMETLRGEKGCPWDKKQTEKAFRTFLLEEVYELIEAIEKDDHRALKEELGDLLFHVVFISQISNERGHFGIREVLVNTYDKMRGRHPHVFFPENGDEKPVETRWEELKKAEKKDYSPVRDVPTILPALLRAYVVSTRAARTGFDWEKLEDVYQKMYEEIEELKEAERTGVAEDIEEEIGDILFTVSNISRFHNVDPEAALRRAIDKFVRRFDYVEQHLEPGQTNLKAMDALWNEIKEKERKGN